MTALVTIECDSCLRSVSMSGGRFLSGGAVRRNLDGWHTRPNPGNSARDICPDCWERGAR